MPSTIYADVPGAIQTTSAGVNTDVTHFRIAPATTNFAPSAWMQGLYVGGAGAGLTQISGIRYRVKIWNTAASTGGTALTPNPRIGSAGFVIPAALSQVQWAVGTLTTPGTGGPVQLLTITSGATGPGGWVAPNLDSIIVLPGGVSTTRSLDVFSASGTASMNFEMSVEHGE